ncbi:MAG: hypothetical protein VX938_12530, partial [Myxococcota bacterium]|nr:hypothetical protein [Myxococcota bacterium]
HNLAEIEDLCTAVAILDHGSIVRQDSVEALVGEAHQVSFRLTSAPSAECLAELRAMDVTTEVEWDPSVDRLRIYVDPALGTAAASSSQLVAELARQEVGFLDLQIGATLEERFTEETS